MTSLLPPGALFASPQNKPLASTGAPLPLAVRKFFLVDGVTTATVYQNANLTVPFSPSNQVTADANGRFSAIYLDPNIVYRAQLFSAGGVLLEDANPYVASPFGVIAAVKQVTTAISNNATPAPDPELVLALPGAGTYTFDALVNWTTAASGATPGLKFQAAYSGSLTANFVSAYSYVGFVNGSATATTVPINTTVSLSLASGGGVGFAPTNLLYIRGTLTVSGAGNLSISWSQQNSSATAVNLLKGCFIAASQLN